MINEVIYSFNLGTSKGTIHEDYPQVLYPFLPDAADVSEEEDLPGKLGFHYHLF